MGAVIWWAEAVLAGALGGLAGVQVVLRRLSFFTMALTHATFPGVVAAAILGVDIYLGGAVAGAIVAVGVAALGRRPGQGSSAATGVLLAGGFALGVGLVATRDGFAVDLSEFLVGSIVTVTGRDVLTTAVVLVAVAVTLAGLARPLLFGGFDAEGARASGVRTKAVDLVLLLVIEVVVVTVVPAVGTIQAVALLVAPAAAARALTSRLGLLTPLAMGIGMASGVLGLAVSGRWNVAAGASITLCATGFLLVATAVGALRRGGRSHGGSSGSGSPEAASVTSGPGPRGTTIAATTGKAAAAAKALR
ncbi:metal ABC transporter permease [Actinoplanes sp. CA-030573]|uniref:metal ABC transporter permease n=1 Tax=Actinoplanes sp. CA-030573 TaxID=3239898 RepID=UPI003D89C030